MPIVTPARHIGTAYGSRALRRTLGTGKRPMYASLLLTPMVDMFIIMVLYLIQQFNATGQILFIDPELKLPEAHRAVEIAGTPPLITIGSDFISVQGRPVEPTAKLLEGGQWQAPKLEAALRDLRRLSTDVAASTGGQVVTESAQGMVMVQADITVPYRVVKKVLFVASKSGFARADFAVTRVADGAAAAAP